MKCPNCGAEIESGKFCEFCGAQLSTEMLKEQEQLNKQGCPKCGSTNVSFRRENQGELQGKNKKVVVHQTVGLCKDCGYTWTTTEAPKKRKTWLWVLGWIFIFPLPLTLILLKKKEMKPALKYGIIAAAWVLYLIFAFAGRSSDKPAAEQPDVPAAVTITQEDSTPELYEETEKASAESTTKAAAQTTLTIPKEDNVSIEYKNALKKAEVYSDMMHMSKKAIYDQLTSEYGEQFPADAAQYAVDNLKADYKENALAKAKTYQEDMSMSTSAIYDQLVSEYGEQFTPEEAQYAIDHLN
jgi:hypothetical protein